MRSKPRVLVFRNQPLPISETFVYNQSMRLERFEAFFLGSKRPRGPRIDLPKERLYLVSEGGMVGLARETAFKLIGYVPQDVLAWARGLKPALVHAHFGPDGALAVPVARGLRLPLIVSFHGTDATMKDEYARRSHISHRLYLRRRGKLARAAACVVVQSEFVRGKVQAQGFPEGKIRLVYHGVDVGQFASAQEAPEWGRVLYVGRLISRKGLHLLIDALRIARTLFPQVQLTVIGDGPMRAEYEAQARRQLGQGFEFLGAQPHGVVKEHMQRSYVFSMPSVTMPSGETETLGLVFLEAQAMGVPVVGSKTGGVPEVVAHGETGLLAEEGNVEELARHLLTLLANPRVRDEMGRAGRARVEQMFDLKKQNTKLEDLYEEVVARSPRTAVDD